MAICSQCSLEKESMSKSPAVVCMDCYPIFKKTRTRERARKRYAENKDKINAQKREWKKNNPEKVKAYTKKQIAEDAARRKAALEQRREAEKQKELKKQQERYKRVSKMQIPDFRKLRKKAHVQKQGNITVRVSDFAIKYGWQYGQVFAIVCEDKLISLSPIPVSKSCLYEAKLISDCNISIGKQYVQKAGFAPQEAFKVTDENGILKILKIEPKIEQKSTLITASKKFNWNHEKLLKYNLQSN